MAASITWFGHATYRLTLPDGRIVFIDPWLTENPACPESLKNPSRCDVILLTHGHFDHIGDVEPLVKAFNPVVVGNLELCSILKQRIGTGRFSEMNTGGTQSIDGLRVTLTPAWHSSSVDSPEGPVYAGMPNGLVIEHDGLATIYYAGDTAPFLDMKLIAQLHAPKISILPIGDHYTMGARGAALAAEMLESTTIIPCHYKSFPVLDQTTDKFRNALPASLKDGLVTPGIGESIAWTETGVG